jgi:ABC-type molybdenum transport system ATPase subunit/photorepair protein PhrA
MSFDFSIPLTADGALTFIVDTGQTVFVLGANGAGKSSLMQRFFSSHTDTDKARRISAHRQTWFTSNTIDLSGLQKRQTEQNILNTDRQPQSRWRDDYSAQRASIAIYDLIDAENVRARSITAAVDEDRIEAAKDLAKKEPPIKIINDLLRLSNLPIEISVQESEQVVASKSGGTKYSISELSDGERNALLIAAAVLTAKPGTILFIDEPERHLHRSIISPLLTNLFERRQDCAFVISTHEVTLPIDNPTARTLLVRGCTYSEGVVTQWDADLVAAEAAIDDDLKRDILGARRALLFVEGAEHSLDKQLYALIFPHVSVIAKSSCRDVEHAVSGIRDAAALHWLNAYGIIDNDRRTEDEITKLHAKGIHVLSVFSVESVYYHLELQRRVAQRQSAVTGADVQQLIDNAKNAALDAVKPHIQRLSERAVEATLREMLMRQLPRRNDIAAAQAINITIDVPRTVAEEVTRFREACNASDLNFIVTRYPVRETPALNKIAENLGFQTRNQYEGAVRKLLMDSLEALQFVRDLFGTLHADLIKV